MGINREIWKKYNRKLFFNRKKQAYGRIYLKSEKSIHIKWFDPKIKTSRKKWVVELFAFNIKFIIDIIEMDPNFSWIPKYVEMHLKKMRQLDM